MKSEYAIGDEVWIYAGELGQGKKPRLSKGRVVYAFWTPFRAFEQYVVLLDDPHFFAMKLRDAACMTDDPEVLPPIVQIRVPDTGRNSRLHS